MRTVALVTLTLAAIAVAPAGAQSGSARPATAGSGSAQSNGRGRAGGAPSGTVPQTGAPSSGAPSAVPAEAPPAQSPSGAIRPQPVGTMSELMIKILYPTSDAIFYITTRTPETDEQWNELQGKTLMLAESANLLLLPAHMRDEKQWPADAKLLRDAAAAAFKAAKAKDVAALDALNDQLYQSCVQCHLHYRPNYGRGR